MSLIPQVLENTQNGKESWDIYSRLLKDRIIFVQGEINDAMSNTIVAQILYLDSLNHDDITMYINSPGGSIVSGFSIIDTMNLVTSKISTINIGMCASMASLLLIEGEEGMRYSLPNAEVLIHQPLGGKQGQASDILIYAKHIKRLKDKIINIYSKKTNKPKDVIEKDIDRDNILTAEESLEYGIIDDILK